MNKYLEYLHRFITDPVTRFGYLSQLGFYDSLSDCDYLKRLFKLRMGYDLNLDNPQTFTEKIQWLKLNDRKDIYSTMVDKYDVKALVSSIIGEEYVIPTLGVWEHFNEIDFDALPNQFVLKCTHDSGGIVIVKDKSKMNVEVARKIINRSLKRRYFRLNREWPYKNVKPRIIAEGYLEDSSTKELRDYKFFAFNGKVKALFIASDRQDQSKETKFDFFDEEFNHLPFTNGHPNAEIPPCKPMNFELMKELAAKLSIEIPHVRVDFYEVDGKLYFGELTFSHWSGLMPFNPTEWDKKFGEWIDLSLVNH